MKPSSLAEPISIGLIGCGRIAELAVLPALAASGGALTVAGVADRNPERAHMATAFGGAVVTASDHRALLEQIDPDLWVVCAPSPAHATILADLARARAPVLCEKPLVVSRGGLVAVRSAWGGRTDRIRVVHNYLHNAARMEVARRISGGDLGAWETTEIELGAPPEYFPAVEDWRKDVERSGGMLLDLGYHHVYLAEWWSGRAIRRARVAAPRGPAQAHQGILLEHEGGGTSRFDLVSLPLGSKGYLRTTIRCARGALRLTGARQLEVQAGGSVERTELPVAFEDGYTRLMTEVARGVPASGLGQGTWENAERYLELLFPLLEQASTATGARARS